MVTLNVSPMPKSNQDDMTPSEETCTRANGHIKLTNGTSIESLDTGQDTEALHPSYGALSSSRSTNVSAANLDIPSILQDDRVIPIAIIGIGCRFPGDATNPQKLWDMLSDGRSGWSSEPKNRFKMKSFYHPSSETNGSVSIPALRMSRVLEEYC
jgi:Beta-ketoacyl synthase, N-terminal domain